MGFWGKLGRGLLKAAPIAASFIPGVGPLAGMAIGAGTSALSKKLEGGSWKDAALAGGIGGATSYGMGKVGQSFKGLGPSKMPEGFVGPQQSFGNKLNLPWGEIGKTAAIGGGALAGAKALRGMGNQGGGNQGMGPSDQAYGRMQNRTPNLESYIRQGSQEAMYDQPWRQPYPADIYGDLGGYRRFQNQSGGYGGDYGPPMGGYNQGGGMGPRMPPWMMQGGMGQGFIDPRSYGGQRGQGMMY